MFIDYENKNGICYEIDISLTFYEYEQDVNAETYELKIENIPQGENEKHIKEYAMKHYSYELISEYYETLYWKRSGMEFFENN